MIARSWNERFLGTTRGRVLGLLRRSERTVNELAAELGLTDNAIRSHLAALERDGLVEQRGVRRGLGKPAHVYGLSAEGWTMFPRAHGLLLAGLLDAARARLPASRLRSLVREAGRRCAASRGPSAGSPKLRLEVALTALRDLGGHPQLERRNSHLEIQSAGCPFGDLVARHPEICELAAAMMSELSGAAVAARCCRTPSPSCRFEVRTGPARRRSGART
jgi:predicted ArsR family transcriptional regulator